MPYFVGFYCNLIYKYFDNFFKGVLFYDNIDNFFKGVQFYNYFDNFLKADGPVL